MREQILEVAENLMLSQGYAATSLGQICEKLKASKAGLLHHFNSKEDLGKAILERHCDARRVLYLEKIPDPTLSPDEILFNYLDSIITFSKRSGAKHTCLVAILTLEMSQSHPDFKKLCEEKFNSWAKNLTYYLTQAKKKYSPKAIWMPKSVAEHFISVLEGSLILSKAKRDPHIIEESVNHFKKYLRSLLESP